MTNVWAFFASQSMLMEGSGHDPLFPLQFNFKRGVTSSSENFWNKKEQIKEKFIKQKDGIILFA